MPQAKNSFVPRQGQKKLIEYLGQVTEGKQISVHWATGYGKSMGFGLTWKHCHKAGIANRLLMVVANDTQRNQIIADFAGDCELIGAPCSGGVWPFERAAADLKAAKHKTSEVFVCTVNQLSSSVNGSGVNTLKDLLTMDGCRWMIGFDEYHHYGQDMPWGAAALEAMRYATFSLAMSATPYRRGADVIFKAPALSLSYEDGFREGVLKEMTLMAYDYSVSVIQEDGGAINYTTTELLDECPDGLRVYEERRSIRYSPQYIQPLMMKPIERLRAKRGQSGVRLQMIVRAMSCLHAKTVCDQAKTLAGDMVIDWIGTGPMGRPDEENRKVRNRFCPPKGRDGIRPNPKIDILVQVSMAGEGFDSVNVAEIVDMFPMSADAINSQGTQDRQFFGRGARVIRDAPKTRLHISVPTDHPLAVFANCSIHEWMDSPGEKIEPKPRKEADEYDFDQMEFMDLPAKREVSFNGEVADEEVISTGARYRELGGPFNPDDPVEFERMRKAIFGHKEIEAAKQSEHARASQLKEYINSATGTMARKLAQRTQEVSGAAIGRFKKEVNGKVLRRFGTPRSEMSPDQLEECARWLKTQIDAI